jgi:anti-anti-sigma factor
MTCRSSRHDKWFIMSVAGKFVVKNLAQIRMAFDEAEKNNESFLAVDLSETTLLDSSALSVLINLNKRVAEKGGKLILLGPNQEISEMFEVVGFNKIIPVYNSIQHYLQSIDHLC